MTGDTPRRPMLWLMVAYLAGMWLRSNPLYLLCYTCVCTTATVYCYAKRSRLTCVLLLFSTALAGATNYQLRHYAQHHSPLSRALEDGRIQQGHTVEVYARIQALYPTPDGVVLELALDYLHLDSFTIKGRGELLRLRCHSAQSYLKVEDTVRALVSSHTGGYLNPGTELPTTFTGTLIGDVELLYRVQPSLWTTVVTNAQSRLHHLISEQLSERTASVVLAAILGNRYFLSPQIEQSFKQSGTYHILVISGSHIALLALLLHLLLQNTHRYLRLTLILSTVWFYSAITGCEPPVLRAALMATLLLAGTAVFRKPDAANSLGVAGVIILALWPESIDETGFQLTFISVGVLVLIVAPLQQHLESIGRWQPSKATPYPPKCPRLLKWLAETLYWSEQELEWVQVHYGFKFRLEKSAMAALLKRYRLQRPLRYLVIGVLATTIVQIALLPISANILHRISPASLLLNLSAEATMAILLIVFILFILAAPLGINLSAALELAVEVFLEASTSTLPSFRPAGLNMLGIFCIGVSVVLAMIFLARWRPLSEHPDSLINKILALVISLSLLLTGVCGSRTQNTPKGLQIDFLDVGQGDCALLRFPDGTRMLVDGGGQIGSGSRFRIGEQVVSRYLWHEGIKSIDYVVATHSDSDHIEGLLAVLENFSVTRLILPSPIGKVPEFKTLEEAATAKGVKIEVWQQGLQKGFREATLRVLWPKNGNMSGENNDSLVLCVEYGRRRILLAADIEASTEAALVAEGIAADVLKVAHHGSRTSSTTAFLQAVNPQVAIISAPRHSRFNHPHPEVMERLQNRRVLITGRTGMVSLITDGEVLNVESYLERYTQTHSCREISENVNF